MLVKVSWKILTDFRGRGGRWSGRVKSCSGQSLPFGQINHPKKVGKSLEEEGCGGK